MCRFHFSSQFLIDNRDLVCFKFVNLFNYSFHFLRFEKRFFFVPFELIVDTQNSLVEGIVSPTAIFLKVLHDCIPSSPFLVAVKIVMLIIA